MKRSSLHLTLTVLVLSALTPAGGLAQDVLDEPGFEVAKYSLMSIEEALRLAEQGDVHAQAELFFRYRHGLNAADAQKFLASAYFEGFGRTPGPCSRLQVVPACRAVADEDAGIFAVGGVG